MFIGHYSVALAGKRLAPRTSLGVLFFAATFVDAVQAIFILAGLETVRIVPGFTKVAPYDLVSVPYSHSLAAGVLWGALAALVYGALAQRKADKKARVAAALIVGGAVLSHFFLDLPVHVPDLPLGFEPSSPRFGLGLWNQPDVTVALELGLVVAGGALYLLRTAPLPERGTATVVVCILLIGLTIATPLFPPPADAQSLGLEELGACVLLPLLALWMDREREVVA